MFPLKTRRQVLPLVICEAMAFEKPVVCSRIDGIPEAVDNDVPLCLNIDLSDTIVLVDHMPC